MKGFFLKAGTLAMLMGVLNTVIEGNPAAVVAQKIEIAKTFQFKINVGVHLRVDLIILGNRFFPCYIKGFTDHLAQIDLRQGCITPGVKGQLNFFKSHFHEFLFGFVTNIWIPYAA